MDTDGYCIFSKICKLVDFKETFMKHLASLYYVSLV